MREDVPESANVPRARVAQDSDDPPPFSPPSPSPRESHARDEVHGRRRSEEEPVVQGEVAGHGDRFGVGHSVIPEEESCASLKNR